MVEAQRSEIISGVTSRFDPDSAMRCCGALTDQRLIGYDTIQNGRSFRVPSVYASVCGSCHDVYFAPEVSDQIDRAIFRVLFPREAEIVRLMEQE